jgi:hypothetical protein
LPMFADGATPGKVKMWTYDEEDEDFTKGDWDFFFSNIFSDFNCSAVSLRQMQPL